MIWWDCTRHFTGSGANADYGSGPYNALIPAGSISVPLEIKIKNDDILEADETFNLTINVSSLPGCINYVVPYQATVTIVDDDGKLIENQILYV